MTVRELSDALKLFPADARVMVSGPDAGWHDVALTRQRVVTSSDRSGAARPAAPHDTQAVEIIGIAADRAADRT